MQRLTHDGLRVLAWLILGLGAWLAYRSIPFGLPAAEFADDIGFALGCIALPILAVSIGLAVGCYKWAARLASH